MSTLGLSVATPHWTDGKHASRGAVRIRMKSPEARPPHIIGSEYSQQKRNALSDSCSPTHHAIVMAREAGFISEYGRDRTYKLK